MTIKISCKDETGGSGCKSGGVSQTITTSTTSKRLTTVIEDNAGNKTTCDKTFNVKVDKDKPTCNYYGENNTWTNNNVTVGINCSDSLSGCVSGNVSATVSTSMQTKGLSTTITDAAGNSTYCSKTFNVKVDKDKPTCSFSGNTPNGSDGWYKSSASITATFNDTGGSGISNRGVSTSSGTYNDSTSYYLSENTKGKTLYCSVKDAVGNVGTNSITVKKDDGSGVSCNVYGANKSWTKNNVKLSYTASTPYSSFVVFSFTSPSDVNAVGLIEAGNEVEYYKNFNGNYGTITHKFNSFSFRLESGATGSCPSKTVGVYYDKEKPTCSVNISSTGISGVSGYITVSDNYSGPKTSRIDFSDLKSSQSYDIYDNVGNTNSCTVNVSGYTVTSYKTCSAYNTCRVSACGNDPCASVINTCKAGWVGRVYGNYYQGCTAQGCSEKKCYASNPFPYYYRQVGTDKCVAVSGTWSDCATGSAQTCQPGYKSCANAECGCQTWSNWSDWSTNSCTDETNKKTCRTATYYGAS